MIIRIKSFLPLGLLKLSLRSFVIPIKWDSSIESTSAPEPTICVDRQLNTPLVIEGVQFFDCTGIWLQLDVEAGGGSCGWSFEQPKNPVVMAIMNAPLMAANCESERSFFTGCLLQFLGLSVKASFVL